MQKLPPFLRKKQESAARREQCSAQSITKQMTHDFKRTLKRSGAAILLLVAEMITLLCCMGDGPGSIPVWCLIAAVVVWVVFSFVYSRFCIGGKRVVVAGWLGICWALPFTLVFTEIGMQLDPLQHFRELVYTNLTLPVLSLLPTLLFLYTEKRPADTPRHRLWPHLLGMMLLFGGIVGMYHYRAQIPYIAEDEVRSALSLSVSRFTESDTGYTAELRINNHTASPITLGHDKKSIRFNHCLRQACIEGLWHGKNRLLCMYHEVVGAYHVIPPHGSVTLTRTCERPKEAHPRPDSASVCFTFIHINGTQYMGYYTLHAPIPPAEEGKEPDFDWIPHDTPASPGELELKGVHADSTFHTLQHD